MNSARKTTRKPAPKLGRNPALTPRLQVTIATSRYGCAQPQVSVENAEAVHYRLINAALLRIAAEIELASISEKWVVIVENERCNVHLELMTADAAEVARAKAVLESVAAKTGGVLARTRPV